MHADLSSNPKHPCKKSGRAMHPSVEGTETGKSWVLSSQPTSQPAQLKWRASSLVVTLSSRAEADTERGRHPASSPASACVHVTVYSFTLVYMECTHSLAGGVMGEP